jgi:hypothetical protein
MLRVVSCLLLLFAMAAVPACGREGVVNNPPVAPAISVTTPAAKEKGVPLNRAIAVAFTKSMDPGSVSNAFVLSSDAGPVTGTMAVFGTVATFKPDALLTQNTLYTATISAVAKDTSGTPLATSFVWQFTTGTTQDTTPPSVTSPSPAAGAAGVSLDTAITATFSEPMDPASCNTSTFTVNSGGAPVTGTVTVTMGGSGSTAVSIATFKPAAPLAHNTTYTATVNTGAKDLAGNAMPINAVWNFSTGNAVVSTTPQNGAVSVSPTAPNITATFAKAMNPATINPQTFTLTFGVSPGVPVTGAVSLDSAGTTATFTPAGPLQANTVFTATITTGATDTTGTPLSSNFSWSFTTGF